MSTEYEVVCVFGYRLDEDSVYEIDSEYSSFEDLVENDESFQLPEGFKLISFNSGYDNTDVNYAVGIPIESIDEYLASVLQQIPSIAPDPTPLVAWSTKLGLKFKSKTPVLIAEVNAF